MVILSSKRTRWYLTLKLGQSSFVCFNSVLQAHHMKPLHQLRRFASENHLFYHFTPKPPKPHALYCIAMDLQSGCYKLHWSANSQPVQDLGGSHCGLDNLVGQVITWIRDQFVPLCIAVCSLFKIGDLSLLIRWRRLGWKWGEALLPLLWQPAACSCFFILSTWSGKDTRAIYGSAGRTAPQISHCQFGALAVHHPLPPCSHCALAFCIADHVQWCTELQCSLLCFCQCSLQSVAQCCMRWPSMIIFHSVEFSFWIPPWCKKCATYVNSTSNMKLPGISQICNIWRIKSEICFCPQWFVENRIWLFLLCQIYTKFTNNDKPKVPN